MKDYWLPNWQAVVEPTSRLRVWVLKNMSSRVQAPMVTQIRDENGSTIAHEITMFVFVVVRT